MPLYLRKDDLGYRFLRSIPPELSNHFGKKNFVYRLGKDRKLAIARCAELTLETNEALEAARVEVANQGSVDGFLGIDFNRRRETLRMSAELPGKVAALWLQSLNADAEARAAGLDDDEFEAMDTNIKEMLVLINRARATGQVSQFREMIHQWVVMRGYELEATEAEWQALTYAVLKHVQTGYNILKARQAGEQLDPPDLSALPAPLAAAWEKHKAPVSLAKKIKRLSDITPDYEEHLKSVEPKSRSTYLSIWKRFVEYTDNKPCNEAKSADVFQFLKSRLDAPTGDKPWSYKYASGRAKRVLLEAFGLAKTLNYVTHNPVEDLRVLPTISRKEEASRKKPRFPFSTNQLNALFSSAWYDPKATTWRGKMKDDLGARYWIPLLCMWHGFRVTEAAQLQTHDVELSLALVHIQVSESEDLGPERTHKNEATKRLIPIHPELVKLGFLDFVRTRMLNYEKGPLFPSALPEPGGKAPKWGRAYEQPFVRFTRDTLGFGSGYGNHSFRHGLEDQIREANVEQAWPAGLSQMYTGRAVSRSIDLGITREEGSEKNYGKGYSPSAMLRYIEKITYPGVVLPPPFTTWLSGREAASKRLLLEAKRWNKAHEMLEPSLAT